MLGLGTNGVAQGMSLRSQCDQTFRRPTQGTFRNRADRGCRQAEGPRPVSQRHRFRGGRQTAHLFIKKRTQSLKLLTSWLFDIPVYTWACLPTDSLGKHSTLASPFPLLKEGNYFTAPPKCKCGENPGVDKSAYDLYGMLWQRVVASIKIGEAPNV